jgi:TRAP-type C4-dicarboxylate transport system permease large subunit
MLFAASLLPGLILALLLVLVAVAMLRELATNGQIQAQLVALLFILAMLWWLYIHLPRFIQKALRSLWQSKKQDKR